MKSIRLPSWSERLLGLDPLPVPPHIFFLDEARLACGRFARPAGGRVRLQEHHAVELPPECFQSGLLGGPLREAGAFSQALGALLERFSTPAGGGASLVLPDAWLRVALAEVGDLPEREPARDEVLRWKLRRLVPFRVEELRVRGVEVTPLARQEEPRRVMLGFALDGLLAQLEEAFATAGVELGQISNASLSLLTAVADGVGGDSLLALALVRPADYTLVFARGGEPVLYRYKAATMGSSGGDLVVRDLRLTRTFLEEHFPGVELAGTLVAAPAEVESLWLDWMARGLGAPAEPLRREHLALAAVDGGAAPWLELAPMAGASLREVA